MVQAQKPKKPVTKPAVSKPVITKPVDTKNAGNRSETGSPYIYTSNEDSAIKERLVALAMQKSCA